MARARPVNKQVSQFDRREFLRRSGYLGAAAMIPGLLAACGEDADAPTTTAAPATTVAAVATTTAAAVTTTSAVVRAGGTLSVRTWGSYAGTLDPVSIPSFLEFQTLAPMYEGLVGWKPGTTEVANLLADTFEASEDGLEFTFTLKEGIPFHNGYGDVTAEDVKFSLERAAATELAASRDLGLQRLAGVDVTGPYSGVIRLNTPYGPFVGSTLTRWSAAIVSKAAVEDLGDQFTTNPVLTGPYQVSEFVPDAGVTLARFDDYGGAASDLGPVSEFDEIRYSVIIDANAAAIGVESGELSYTQIGPNDVERFRGNSSFRVDGSPLLGWEILGMNTQHRLLGDPNLRMAIRYALEPQQIVDGALAGLNETTSFLVPEDLDGHWGGATTYTQDLDRAREFFAAAGSPPDELEILCISAPHHVAASEIISAQLAEVGINTTIRVGESPDAQAWRAQNPPSEDSAFHYTTGIYLAANALAATEPFHGSRIGGSTTSFMDVSEYNETWSEASTESDAAARNELYIRLQQIFEEQMPAALLAKPTQWYAGLPSIEPVFSPIGFALYQFFGGTV